MAVSLANNDAWERLLSCLGYLIFPHVEREDLRNCRLVNRAARRDATPLLFFEVHLSPSTNSLHRLSRIAARQDLVKHVHILKCHTWGLVEHLIPTRDHLRSFVEHFPYLAPTCIPEKLTDLHFKRLQFRAYSAYLDEVIAQRDFNNDPAPTLLQRTLSRFTQLHTVVWAATEVDSMGVELPLHSQLFLRTGVRTLGTTKKLDLAETQLGMGCHHLTTFLAHGLRWSDFQKKSEWIPALANLLRSVETLRLSFDISDLGNEEIDPSKADSFNGAITQANSIRDLRIGLCGRLTWGRRNHVNPLWSILRLGYHPQLQSLTLDSVLIEEDILVDFIERHRDTLRSLTIYGLDLITGPDTGRRSSVVRAIWRLRQVSQLQEVFLHDRFADGCAQAWSVHQSADDSCLRKQVEVYICGQGNFPFDGLEGMVRESEMKRALSNDEEDRRGLGERVEEWHRRLAARSDQSWTFNSELLE